MNRCELTNGLNCLGQRCFETGAMCIVVDMKLLLQERSASAGNVWDRQRLRLTLIDKIAERAGWLRRLWRIWVVCI